MPRPDRPFAPFQATAKPRLLDQVRDVLRRKHYRVRVVSAVTGQQVCLVDFGDEDGEIKFLRDRVIKVAR